jgi:hypothetical protein
MVPEARRGLHRFALVQVAGQLAVEWQILPSYTSEDVIQAIRVARDAWLMEIEEGLSDGKRGISNIVEFIHKNRIRFRSINLESVLPNIAGYWDEINKRYEGTEKGCVKE